MDEPDFANRVIDEYVKPFYLSIDTRQPDPALASQLATKAREASTDEVLWMLSTLWRPRRVGAWFTLLHPEPIITPALLTSLETSMGTLTAPGLGFAAVRRVGAEALPTLHRYQSRAAAEEYGGLQTISVLIEHVGGTSELAQPSPEDTEWLRSMNMWADLLEDN